MAGGELWTAPPPSTRSADAAQDAGYQTQAADRPAISRDRDADGGDARGIGGFLLSPGVTVGCRIAMGVAMAFLLIIAI
jgi:hypothetical protein